MVRKIPDYLYISSPPPTPTPPASSSYLSLPYSSPAALFSETSSNALAVSDRIPGFKTSAAFLNSLRANLRLAEDQFPFSSSATPSLTNTPDSLHPTMASSTGSLPPPSPSPLTQPPSTLDATSDPLANIPPLSTETATTDDDKVAALRLVADSVAQQRQLASRALIAHPLAIAALVGLMAITGQYMYKGASGDLLLIGTTFAGLIMTYLISIRFLTGAYLSLAEEVGTWAWLDRDRDRTNPGKEDEILITKFGDDLIGALIMRGVTEITGTNTTANPSKKRRQNSGGGGGGGSKAAKGVIRAWTVKNRYRRKGIGGDLLEDAVKLCREKGWSGPVFADDHANSGRVLPAIFNGGFERRDRKAREMLDAIVAAAGSSGSASTPTTPTATTTTAGGKAKGGGRR